MKERLANELKNLSQKNNYYSGLNDIQKQYIIITSMIENDISLLSEQKVPVIFMENSLFEIFLQLFYEKYSVSKEIQKYVVVDKANFRLAFLNMIPHYAEKYMNMTHFNSVDEEYIDKLDQYNELRGKYQNPQLPKQLKRFFIEKATRQFCKLIVYTDDSPEKKDAMRAAVLSSWIQLVSNLKRISARKVIALQRNFAKIMEEIEIWINKLFKIYDKSIKRGESKTPSKLIVVDLSEKTFH